MNGVFNSELIPKKLYKIHYHLVPQKEKEKKKTCLIVFVLRESLSSTCVYINKHRNGIFFSDTSLVRVHV